MFIFILNIHANVKNSTAVIQKKYIVIGVKSEILRHAAAINWHTLVRLQLK